MYSKVITTTNAGEDVGKQEPLYTLSTTNMERSMKFSK
jgi:hypothetical protein